jgi:excisionase family DNA binding protein
VPPDDDSTAAAGRSGQDPRSGWLACSVNEAARLTGLSRDLLYDEMRRGDLASVKVGRRRLITRQHLQQFPGIAS